MSTYQCRCTAYGKGLEAVQKLSDPALTTCPVCSGDLQKIYSAIGVVFKGSGFHVTDSHRSTPMSRPASGSETKTDSAPTKSTETTRAAS